MATSEPLFVPEPGELAKRPTAPLAEVVDGTVTPITDPMALMAWMVQQRGEMTGEKVAAMNALADLKHKLDEREAVRMFNAAMVAFRQEAPVIVKRRGVSLDRGGSVAYKFAALEDIEYAIGSMLLRHGFAYTFPEGVIGSRDGWMRTACELTHIGGHAKTTTIDLPIPTQMRVNATQQGGAALSYGRRYALCSALGLRIVGEDTDGHGLHATDEVMDRAMTCVTFEQAVQINDMLETFPDPADERAKLLAWLSRSGREIRTCEEIPASLYNQVIAAIEKRRPKRA